MTKISNFKSNGFTLLELLAAIAILSTVLLIVFPKIPLLDDYAFNANARRLAALLRYIDESASAKKVYYRVWFYLEKESLAVEYSKDGIEFKQVYDTSLKGFSLKDGIDMQDIVISGLGKISQGETAVVFNPASGSDAFNIHLKKTSRLLTISYNPYSGKVKIFEGYV